jgi:hypothetical protein
MLQDKLIDAAQYQEARPLFAAGPLLTKLLSDPIMHMLMAADRVEYRDIEAVLQRARAQLGIGTRGPMTAPASRDAMICSHEPSAACSTGKPPCSRTVNQ